MRRGDSFANRSISFFADIPVTKAVLLLMVVSFLGQFLTRGMLTGWLAFDPRSPWALIALITYPLSLGPDIISLLINGYVFFMFAGSLERSWGTRRFVIFLLLANLAALVVWELGILLVFRTLAPVFGPWFMLSSVVVAWAWLNHEQTILFFFVLPMQAKWLAWITIVMLFFGIPMLYQISGPEIFLLGFFALGGVGATWLYSRWQRQWGWIPRRPREAKRPAPPPTHRRVTILDRLLAPYREWQRRRNVTRLRKTWKLDD